MTSRKILLVDDDAELSEALIDQLSLYDEFELTHAASAGAGLHAAREGHVDLIIMDVIYSHRAIGPPPATADQASTQEGISQHRQRETRRSSGFRGRPGAGAGPAQRRRDLPTDRHSHAPRPARVQRRP